MRLDDVAALDAVRFDAQGLVPVIAQDAYTGEVLMLAWANRAALERSLAERCMWFYSRSRAALWRKGETSGNELRLRSLHHDCDADALLALVEPAGPACHTGERSCFSAPPTLSALGDVIRGRAASPEGSGHTRRLLRDANLRLKKLGEEATELALACAAGSKQKVSEEAADLVYHLLVACAAAGVGEADIVAELARRRAPS
jgi:phosphoribosyl-ATP pyrophosphohydrolase/phosphoribosyl-AMP cyclohydrolase